MAFEISTKVKNLSFDGRRQPVMVITWTMVPRGSGNRNKVRRLAEILRNDVGLKSHIVKVVVGTTSVHLHLRPSLALYAAINDRLAAAKEAADADVPGQMTLPLSTA